MDAEVFHHFRIVHGDLTCGDGIALDGGPIRRARVSAACAGDRRRCFAIHKLCAIDGGDYAIRFATAQNRLRRGSRRSRRSID
ncbi:Uncharacterised protein [Bacteroides xylanisolvens]|nr:Uncharacterised protein [Bacteroides xylanisolvens]